MNQEVLETLYLVLAHPREGLREVTRGKPFKWALVTYVIVAATWRAALILEFPGRKTGPFGSSGFVDVLVSAMLALVVLFVVAALLHAGARILRGKGSYLGLVCAMAFAASPMALFAPLSVLSAFMGLTGFIMYLVGALVLCVWVFVVLAVFCLCENYGFSARRALAAYLLPIGALSMIAVLTFLSALVLH